MFSLEDEKNIKTEIPLTWSSLDIVRSESFESSLSNTDKY